MPRTSPNTIAGTPSIKSEIDEMKRRRILEEAIEQFFDKGYEATSLESIADGLGVTKQFIYSRFRSKAELLVSVCQAGAAAADQTVALSSTLTGTPTERLATIIRYFVGLQIEHRLEVALYFRESKSLPADEAHAIDESKMRFHRMLCALLNEGKACGEFEFADTSLAASALGGMASWAFTWFQPEGRWVAESVAQELAILALRTVAATSRPPCPAADGDLPA